MVPVKQRITTLVLIAAVIVLLDQATKYLVVHYLTQRVVIIPGFLDLVSVYNRGGLRSACSTTASVYSGQRCLRCCR